MKLLSPKAQCSNLKREKIPHNFLILFCSHKQPALDQKTIELLIYRDISTVGLYVLAYFYYSLLYFFSSVVSKATVLLVLELRKCLTSKENNSSYVSCLSK